MVFIFLEFGKTFSFNYHINCEKIFLCLVTMIRLQEIYLVFVCLSWIGERKWKRDDLQEGKRRGKVKENRWKKKRRLENIRWLSKHLSGSSIGWKTCIWTIRQTNRTFWTKLPSREEMMVRESTTCSTLVLQWPPSWRISPYVFFMLAARDFVVL